MKKQFYYLARVGFCSFLVLCTTILSFAQNRTVTGRVVGATDSLPLAGVTVQIKGQSTAVATDINGSYSIGVPDGAVLVFTHTGYEGRQITVGSNSTIDVQLKLSSGGLSEVVVIGYGIVKKRDLIGSVGSVKATQLQEWSSASVNEALSGRIVGV